MIPHASDRVEEWVRQRAQDGRLLVALDFDGTLAPIVDRPHDARPLPACADAVRRLAGRDDTLVAVVSGRGLADVRSRLGTDGIYYAGNHGMEIDGPGVVRTVPEAREARPRLEACLQALGETLRGVDGVEVEDKGLTLSIHYRRVAADDQDEARRRAVDACAGRAGLRITEGKKVVEVRPDVDWHKGHAVGFLMGTLAGGGARLHALYLGDDVTDEDAFRAVRGRGAGIVVDDPPPADTAAAAFLRSPEEVAGFLAELADG